MSWRCFRCGEENDGVSCQACDGPRPALDARLAILGGTFNVNLGTVNNVYVDQRRRVRRPDPPTAVSAPPRTPLLSPAAKESAVTFVNVFCQIGLGILLLSFLLFIGLALLV